MSGIEVNILDPNFQGFIDNQNKIFDGRGDKIVKRMKEYATDVYPLPITHTCDEVGKYARKIFIPDYEAIIIFDKFDDHWDLLEGYHYFPRVA